MTIQRITRSVVAVFGLLAIITACGGTPVTVTAPTVTQPSQQSTLHGGTTTANTSTPQQPSGFPYAVTQGTTPDELKLTAIVMRPENNVNWPDPPATRIVTYAACIHDIKHDPTDYEHGGYDCNIAFTNAPPQSYWVDLVHTTPIHADPVDTYYATVRTHY